MSGAAVVEQRLPGAAVRQSGLEIDSDLSYEQWLQVGKSLARMSSLSAWALGDWLLHGQFSYERSKYEEGLALTGLSYQTLRNMVYVAGRFALSRRRDTISFSHHAEVAALPPSAQDTWLIRAESESLSVAALRDQMRQSRTVTSGEESGRLPALSLRPVTAAEVAAWNEAAEKRGLPVAEWAREVLDEAAGAKP